MSGHRAISKRDLLAQIKRYQKTRGYPPTITELAQALDCSRSTVQHHVEVLVDQGRLTRDPQKARTLRVVA